MNTVVTIEHKAKARPSRNRAAPWVIAILLALVSAIPIAVGIYILVELAHGHIRPETIRHLASPTPVVLHVIGAAIFVTLGAFQFVPPFRRRFPNWHRIVGRGLLACGLVAGLSGLWMTLFYTRLPDTNDLLFVIRLFFSSAMVVFIGLGFTAIRRHDIARHRAWMMRAYAIGLGAGTQAFVFMLAEGIAGPRDQLGKALLMGLSWAANLAIAELVIRRRAASNQLPMAHRNDGAAVRRDGDQHRKRLAPWRSVHE
jgi:uncharacterized membrane protein